jgi:hypothetical protein
MIDPAQHPNWFAVAVIGNWLLVISFPIALYFALRWLMRRRRARQGTPSIVGAEAAVILAILGGWVSYWSFWLFLYPTMRGL